MPVLDTNIALGGRFGSGFLTGLQGGIKRFFPLLALAAVSIGLAGALCIDWHTPLWLDEDFTAAIARDNLRGLYAWCLEDPNAPLYYGLIWLWGHIAGTASTVLRLPSTILWLSTLLFVGFRGHAERDIRLAWVALLALWTPGWQYASEARCYALLLLLSCIQAVLYVRLIDSRRRADAFRWAAVAALACLTHYYALMPTALQGLFFLAVRPRHALRVWPAALLFVPVFAWLAIHLPHLARYATPDTSWYPPMTAKVAGNIVSDIWGGLPYHLALAFAAIVGLQLRAHIKRDRPWPYTAGETLLAAAALLTFAMMLGSAFFRPALLVRYLIPTVPGIFFGVVLALRRAWPSSRFPLAVLLIVWMTWAMVDVSLGWRRFTDERYGYNFDQPSAWMEDSGLKRFTFFWDHPNAGLYAPQRLTAMATVPLRRDGWSGPAASLLLRDPHVDPNTVLARIADRPGDGLIWAYDSLVLNSMGNRHPPSLPMDTLHWACHNFGGQTVTVLACIRR
ncbi:hypothetical protein HZF05_16195 [Sphingomonas sp. CGMCC 1.13654]|uniref:Glycosyltransferase RgtA/B/C/D-like domain-containing protein n=1 Tax=Sphingomonas chungangi TaxID=2683589 RepID=A0A838L9C7_9SPHN|nr:glycosyltransferase family 39 protein [Sphingomonas chungangi]MBA2935627.1 hypothetical protein [Sphingomonas chungangi]MVW54318.1 hypothetical protein [Sphingomonas chungangi]